jgi:ABC-2 type transport system ATP-binding protein
VSGERHARRPVLVAQGIERAYGGRVALAPTDLELHPGEVVGIVGPNGAGKSTLLAILAGAIPPGRGRLVQGSPHLRVGWVPQRPAQYGHLSARENLELFAGLDRLPHPKETASAVLERMGLPDSRQPSSQLSVGNQQRLNLAIGLLGGASVLLLDEPTASLDPAHRRALYGEIDQLRHGGGTVLFATHIVEEVKRLAGRVIVLLDGRIVFRGSPHELSEVMPELEGG